MITRFSRPDRFQNLSLYALPIFIMLSVVALIYGFYVSLWNSPADYQQGDAVRIMYIHVPSAWVGLGIYTSAAVSAFIALVWRHRLAEIYMDAAIPLGAVFTLMCLVTGALWGQPIWGTWWVWDARLTSVLVLFVQYVGYYALRHAFDDEQRGLQIGAVLLLIGAINIPVIKFSVDWWNTLHQPASISRLGKPTLDSAMLKPLLVMALGFASLYGALVLLRMQTLMLQAKNKARMMRQLWQDAHNTQDTIS
jgi:heme exporter protein C